MRLVKPPPYSGAAITEQEPAIVWNVSESVPTGLCHVQPARRLIVTALVVTYLQESLATFLADGGYPPGGCRSSRAFSRCPDKPSAAPASPSWWMESTWGRT